MPSLFVLLFAALAVVVTWNNLTAVSSSTAKVLDHIDDFDDAELFFGTAATNASEKNAEACSAVFVAAGLWLLLVPDDIAQWLVGPPPPRVDAPVGRLLTDGRQ